MVASHLNILLVGAGYLKIFHPTLSHASKFKLHINIMLQLVVFIMGCAVVETTSKEVLCASFFLLIREKEAMQKYILFFYWVFFYIISYMCIINELGKNLQDSD